MEFLKRVEVGWGSSVGAGVVISSGAVAGGPDMANGIGVGLGLGLGLRMGIGSASVNPVPSAVAGGRVSGVGSGSLESPGTSAVAVPIPTRGRRATFPSWRDGNSTYGPVCRSVGNANGLDGVGCGSIGLVGYGRR